MIPLLSGPDMSALLGGISAKVVGKLDEASVDEFKTLQRFISKQDVSTASDGATKHALKAFFETHDLNKNYCGLVRVPNAKGSPLWTTPEHAVDIERERKQRDVEVATDSYLLDFICPCLNNATKSP
jgi:hypothetical protein